MCRGREHDERYGDLTARAERARVCSASAVYERRELMRVVDRKARTLPSPAALAGSRRALAGSRRAGGRGRTSTRTRDARSLHCSTAELATAAPPSECCRCAAATDQSHSLPRMQYVCTVEVELSTFAELARVVF